MSRLLHIADNKARDDHRGTRPWDAGARNRRRTVMAATARVALETQSDRNCLKRFAGFVASAWASACLVGRILYANFASVVVSIALCHAVPTP
jgi:hypothetical protein